MTQLQLIDRPAPKPELGYDYRRPAGPVKPVRSARPPQIHKSTLRIHLDWLDEIRTLIARHGGDGVEAWQAVPAMPDLADELRNISDGICELGDELREMANSIQHASWDAERKVKP